MSWGTERVQVMFTKDRDGAKWTDLYAPGRNDFESRLFRNRRDLARELLVAAVPEGSRVFDLGCGAGPFAVSIADLDYRYIGSDLSADMLGAAAERLPASTPLFQADCQDLPLADGVADAVVGLGVISYVPDKEAALAEMDRVLGPDGTLIITFRNAGSRPLFDPAVALKRLALRVVGRHRSGDLDDEPGAFLDPAAVERLLAAQGFRTDRRDGLGYGPLRLRGRAVLPNRIDLVLDRALSLALRPFGRARVRAADVVVLTCTRSGSGTRSA